MSSPVRRSLALMAAGAITTTVLMSGPLSLGAQESAKGKTQASKSQAGKSEGSTSKAGGRVAPPDPTHRVPPGYARLGLTDQQKERLYKIQGDYYPKIQALQKQLDALRSERETKCEAVLTREQKQLLNQEIQQKKAAAEARKAVSRAAVDETSGKN